MEYLRRLAGPAALALAAAPVLAAGPASASSEPAFFDIRGFDVRGDNPLAQGETARALAPFLRQRQATLETLQQATAALEAALRANGHGLHRVSLPAQEFGEVVRLEIVRFTVGKVELEGRSRYSEKNVRASLPELREGEAINFRRLAVQMAIANENPNKQVQVGLRESEEADRVDAAVSVKEQSPWMLAASVSNAGSKSTGRDRLTLSAGHTNLLDRDHQVLAAYTTSLERPGDVRQFGVSYRAPLYAQGMILGATYTRSDVVGTFGGFTSTGAGHAAGLSGTWLLPPSGGYRGRFTGAVEDKVFDATVINDTAIGVPRRSRPVVLGHGGQFDDASLSLSYNVDLAWNTGSGPGNDLESYRSEDPRVAAVHWKALRGSVSAGMPAAAGWQVAARAQVQYSPDALISGEQFGLGGIGSVRGTRTDRPVTGDSGAAVTIEAATPELGAGLRLVGFAEGGWVASHGADGVGKLASDRVASVGLGLRWTLGAFAAALDYGRIVLGSRMSAAINPSAPRRGEDRVYLNLSGRF